MALDPYRSFRLFLYFAALIGTLASVALVVLLIYVLAGRVFHLH